MRWDIAHDPLGHLMKIAGTLKQIAPVQVPLIMIRSKSPNSPTTWDYTLLHGAYSPWPRKALTYRTIRPGMSKIDPNRPRNATPILTDWADSGGNPAI